MSRLSSFQSRSLLTLLGIVVALPFVVIGAVQCTETMFTLPSRWIPAEFKQQQSLRYFIDRFESGDFIVISWPGCTLEDPRLAALENAFEEFNQPESLTEDAALFDKILTGRSAIDELAQSPLDLQKPAAVQRLRGVLVGPDGQSSCAVIALTEHGAYERQRALEVVLDMAERVCDVSRDQFRLAGPPIEGIVLDDQGRYAAQVLRIPSVIISALLCWYCLRSWVYTLAVLGVALFAEALILAIVYASGVTMSAVLIILAPLVFVLTVSAGVHLVNYYCDETKRSGGLAAVKHAVASARLPCALAAATTAIGLGSLMVSDIIPIVQFGALAPVGVVSGVALLFLVLPGVLERWPTGPNKHSSDHSTLARFSDAFAGRICRHSTWIILVCGATMILAGYGLVHLRTSVAFDSLFDPGSRIVRDYAWLEEDIGPMATAEVIVHIEPEAGLRMVDQLLFVQRLQRIIGQSEEVGGTMSAATFAPNIPLGAGMRRISRRAVINDWLEKSREDLDASGFYSEDDQQQSWRISARIPATKGIDYQHVLDKLEKLVAPELQGWEDQWQSGVSVDYTGIMPMVCQVQNILLQDLIRSFLAAFILVALTMILALRSVIGGLVAMVPNLFPVVTVFGIMGWLDLPIDIGVMMTASVALGIAVDDTFHYLIWFRKGRRNGLSQEQSVRDAFHHCARAMVQTTLICSLGMLVFTFSDFLPTQRFAWMIASLLVVALVGDLMFLPAMLSVRLGRLYGSDREAESA